MICSPPTSPLRTSIKWEGVSFISNIHHDEECLRVWKAYKIGPGKLVPYIKFNWLEQGATAIPELGLGKEVRITAYSAPSLSMGWALKCSRAR
ncbi:hypothetical protein pdam_00025612, partial [Pocillopora damicornis]